MAVGLNYKVILDEKLTTAEGEKIQKDISKMSGVLSAHFNEKAKEIGVTHTGLEDSIQQRLESIEGVKSVQLLYVA